MYAEINTLDDALSHVRRLKAEGAHSVKNYNQPRREQRQMVVAAAQREGMEVVPEGGSLFNMDISLIQDGNSTLEHNLPVEHFYDDVVSLWSQSKTNYTPTLVVTYGGPAGDPYWRQHMDVWKHPLLSKHAPPALLAAGNVRRHDVSGGGLSSMRGVRARRRSSPIAGCRCRSARTASRRASGRTGSCGRSYAAAGARSRRCRAGTIMPATSLGYAKDVGSLEVGKLADLVVLDADPTVDIRNSDHVYRVMLGGRLYDPATLNEVATGTRKRAPYWWEGTGDLASPASSGRAAADGD